jgi:hypothetical protein
MIHLGVEKMEWSRRKGPIQGVDDFLATNDPEHVESSQGVEGHQTTRWGLNGRLG